MDELDRISNNPGAMIPAGFAEKAMGSLMQLHSQLMDEKERRVELHRRLMEKEQSLAELRMYVKLLEEKGGMGQTEAPVRAIPSPKPSNPPPPKAASREAPKSSQEKRVAFGWRSW